METGASPTCRASRGCCHRRDPRSRDTGPEVLTSRQLAVGPGQGCRPPAPPPRVCLPICPWASGGHTVCPPQPRPWRPALWAHLRCRSRRRRPGGPVRYSEAGSKPSSSHRWAAGRADVQEGRGEEARGRGSREEGRDRNKGGGPQHGARGGSSASATLSLAGPAPARTAGWVGAGGRPGVEKGQVGSRKRELSGGRQGWGAARAVCPVPSRLVLPWPLPSILAWQHPCPPAVRARGPSTGAPSTGRSPDLNHPEAFQD